MKLALTIAASLILGFAAPVQAQLSTILNTRVACALDPVKIRAGINIPRGQDPIVTIRQNPFLSRTAVATLQSGECVMLRNNKRNFISQGGYRWISVRKPNGTVGWAASEFFVISDKPQ